MDLGDALYTAGMILAFVALIVQILEVKRALEKHDYPRI